MTCIVGWSENNKVTLSCDSRGSNGHKYVTRKDSKIFEVGDFVFGFTSSYRMGQIIKYHFNPPTRKEGVSDEQYLHVDILEHIIKILTDRGYNRVNNNEVTGGFFIIGWHGKLYEVECDYQIAQFHTKYAAVGCGEDYAKSCLWTLEQTKSKLSVKERLEMAIRCAASQNSGVDDNILFIEKTWEGK